MLQGIHLIPCRVVPVVPCTGVHVVARYLLLYLTLCRPFAVQAATMAVTCQALPVTRPAKTAPAQQPGPLVRPHGFSQARRTVPFAFNPAISSFGDGMGVPVAPFVRPDCPPDAEDAAGSSQRQQRRPKAEGQRARPQFRSALEQVRRDVAAVGWHDVTPACASVWE